MMPNDPNEVSESPEAEAEPVVELDDQGVDQAIDQDADDEPNLPIIQWQAHEYVHHDKTTKWYLGLAGVAAALIAIAVVTQQWLGIAVFVSCAGAIAVYAKRPPRLLSYTLDELGVNIEGKVYAYEQFRSFGLLQDADWHTIDLEPMQRFMPRLSLLFDDADRDAIVERLAAELPRADRTPDLVERLTHALRF